jgi:endoglucanase
MESMKLLSLISLLASLASVAFAKTNKFRGVNWADQRDNYVDGWIILSGLSSADNYAVVAQKADQVLSQFKSDLNANTLRVPINPPTVLETWWKDYCAVFDTAVSKGMNLIISCWEGVGTKDGKIDNIEDFWSMWSIVTTQFGAKSNIYFEIFNEPFGYSESEWTDIAAEFLSRFPSIPQNRIIVSGVGYNDHLEVVGKDNRFSNCLLSLHIYGFWNTSMTTPTAWKLDFQERIAGYQSRSIVSEFGAPMTTGLDYNGKVNNDAYIAYMYGVTDGIRDYSMGAVYWPGLRDGDSYSVETRVQNRGNNDITLSVTNKSGLDRIQYGWGM